MVGFIYIDGEREREHAGTCRQSEILQTETLRVSFYEPELGLCITLVYVSYGGIPEGSHHHVVLLVKPLHFVCNVIVVFGSRACFHFSVPLCALELLLLYRHNAVRPFLTLLKELPVLLQLGCDIFQP